METPQMPVLTHFKRLLLQYRFIIISLFVSMSGFLLILLKERMPFSDIARDFGLAFLTAGTIGLTVEYYTRRQFEALVVDRMGEALEACSITSRLAGINELLFLGNELRSLGLRKIHLTRPDDLLPFIQAAGGDTEIRLLGVCMMSLTSHPAQDLLQRKLEEGCFIRLLTLDPDSEFVTQRAIDDGLKDEYDYIRTEIKASDHCYTHFISHRHPDLRPKIQIGHYDEAPRYFLVSTNKAMIVGFYLRGGRGELFPHLELEVMGGGMYEPFIKHFDSLWAARKEIQGTSGSD
jgi:hypothetical protein